MSKLITYLLSSLFVIVLLLACQNTPNLIAVKDVNSNFDKSADLIKRL